MLQTRQAGCPACLVLFMDKSECDELSLLCFVAAGPRGRRVILQGTQRIALRATSPLIAWSRGIAMESIPH